MLIYQHTISHVREEQVLLVSCALVTYSVHEHTYILKIYYKKNNNNVAKQGGNLEVHFLAVQFHLEKILNLEKRFTENGFG